MPARNLTASDPAFVERTWQAVIEQLQARGKLVTRIKALRKLNGLTQETFAEKSGISYKYYQAIEAGRKRDLRLSTLERLVEAYGIAL